MGLPGRYRPSTALVLVFSIPVWLFQILLPPGFVLECNSQTVLLCVNDSALFLRNDSFPLRSFRFLERERMNGEEVKAQTVLRKKGNSLNPDSQPSWSPVLCFICLKSQVDVFTADWKGSPFVLRCEECWIDRGAECMAISTLTTLNDYRRSVRW